MAGQADTVSLQQTPEIDQVGPGEHRVARQGERLAALDAVARLIDADHEMIGIVLGKAQRAPADAATGVENERRFGVPAGASGQRCGVGLPVVIENRFAERVGEMAPDQFRQIGVRLPLGAADEAGIAFHQAARSRRSGRLSSTPAATSMASISSAALTGRNCW